MKINRSEQETVITYAPIKGEWTFYTCVPSHINSFLKNPLLRRENIEVLSSHEGKPTSIRFKAEKSIVTKNILKSRILSEDHKRAMQQGRKTKPQNRF